MPFPVTHGKRRPGATNGPREERRDERGGRETQREGGWIEREREIDGERNRAHGLPRSVFSANERHLRDTIISLTFWTLGVSPTGPEETYPVPFSLSNGSRCIHTFTRVRGCVRRSLRLLAALGLKSNGSLPKRFPPRSKFH